MSIVFCEKAKQFHLSNANVSYILKVTEEGQLVNLYWGKKMPDADYSGLMDSFNGAASFDSREGRLPYEMPCQGTGYYGDASLKVKNAQGNDVVYLTYAGYEIYAGKKALKGLPAVYTEDDSEAETLVIELEDKLTGLRVYMSYTLFANSDAIAKSIKFVNTSADEMRVTRLPVASVSFYGMDFDVIHLHGAWARERHVERARLTHMGARVESMRGASGHEENPFIALCRPETTEFSGEAWAMNFVYSGSFLAEAEAHNSDNARLTMGMNPSVFEWLLKSGEEFQTPEVIMVYSDNGFNAMSQIYHKLYRTRLVRGEWRDKERPILINNWEATYFDFTPEKIMAIAEKAAKIGIELFVLDDGWFGVRNIDNCSLGDWVVNEKKLPGGLKPLAENINSLGMKFGLWFEPEMISPNSDLYRAHPDWCLHIDGRKRTEQRQQLILDMSRSDVQDYVVEAVSKVLSSANIEYVKWDMNRNMSEYFSAVASAERQMETQHRYMLGLYSVMDRIVSAFPHILFESCSGGGGRFDAGLLYYMPQTWTSDDTDPVERLKIQYGTSYAYPTSAMGAHISASPNHQTGRMTTMNMRGDVAMSGNFGYEIDLSRLSEEDLKTAEEYVKKVKHLRGILQKGTFTRLVSPFEGNYCSWQFVSADGSSAVLCAFKRLAEPAASGKRVYMKGLDENAIYTDAASGVSYSGAQLMYAGIPVRYPHGDYASITFEFKKA